MIICIIPAPVFSDLVNDYANLSPAPLDCSLILTMYRLPRI